MESGFEQVASRRIVRSLEEYYRSAHWKEVRLSALRRAGWRCQLNHDHPGPLEVHHRTYMRLGHELPEDLFVLCEACHCKFHDVLPKQRTAQWLPFPPTLPSGDELN